MKPRASFLSRIKQALYDLPEVQAATAGRVISVISVISPPAAISPATLQETVDAALAGDRAPADWPAQYAAFWSKHPRPSVSYAAALAGLERQTKDIARSRDAHDEDDGNTDRLAYLRGPQGQHDRETIWRGGLGNDCGPGGFRPGWAPDDPAFMQYLAEVKAALGGAEIDGQADTDAEASGN